MHQSYQNLFGNEAYAKSRTTTLLDMLNSSINLAEVVKEANGLIGNIKKAFDCDGVHPLNDKQAWSRGFKTINNAV